MGGELEPLPDVVVVIVELLVFIMQIMSLMVFVFEQDVAKLKAASTLSRQQQDDVNYYAETAEIGRIIRRYLLAAALILIAARICGYI